MARTKLSKPAAHCRWWRQQRLQTSAVDCRWPDERRRCCDKEQTHCVRTNQSSHCGSHRVVNYTLCLKKTSHLRLAITLTHMNGFFYIFGRNVTDKVGNQNFTIRPQITCASAPPDKTRKHENHIFTQLDCVHTQCTCAMSSWKKKLSSMMCLIASNRDNKISH